MATADVVQPAPVLTPKPPNPLRVRNFQLLLWGSSISLIGDQFYFIAMPWLVLQQTGSALAMGTVMMSGAIPRTVLMLMGGAVSDRISPRKVMIFTAFLRAVLVSVVGLLIWTKLLQTWELYALAAAFGTAGAFDGPAAQAFMPSLVHPEQIVRATSILELRTLLATVIGPVPAGFIIRALGIAWAFFIDATSFLFIIGALLRLPDPPATQANKKPIFFSIWEGLQYVSKDIPLRSLMLLALGINFCLDGPIALGLAYIAKTKFGSATMLGIMLSAVAAGTIAGAILAGVWKIRHRGTMILLVAALLALMLGLLGVLNSKWAFPAISFLMGMTAGMADVHISAWIMQRIDASVRGRVSSWLTLVAIGTAPLSLAVAGLLITVSVKVMFVLAGSMLLLVTLVAATQKTVRQIQ
ncbi:MAG TPA: MFS transporter [Blattabacteriaceae bacterium]|jgi:MFS family permease|nr:MFS transporter [Blattabacteriaceae bacterium]